MHADREEADAEAAHEADELDAAHESNAPSVAY